MTIGLTRRHALQGIGAAGVAGLAAATTRSVFTRIEIENMRRRGSDDRETILRAIGEVAKSGGGEIHFAPGREYFLGGLRPGETMFTLRDMRGISFIGHGAQLRCETRGNGQTQLFLAQRCSDLVLEDLVASDAGADPRQEWRGMAFLHCETTAGPIHDVRISRTRVESAVSPLIVTGDASSARAQNFTLEDVRAHNCYYGACFEENGDVVRGSMRVSNCRRAYFAYGVRDHALDLSVEHDGVFPGGDAALLIKRYLRDTSNIRLEARFAGVLAWRNLAKLEQQPPPGESGTIEDVALNLSVAADSRSPWDTAGLAISAYRSGHQVERSNDIWSNVSLTGCLGPVRTVTRELAHSTVRPLAIHQMLADCA